MSADVMEKVKSEVSILEVAEDLGIEIAGQTGNVAEAHCIFHHDGEHPNLKFHLDANSYHCYSCGAGDKYGTKWEHELMKDEYKNWEDKGSDIIGFYANVHKISIGEAKRALASEKLGIKTLSNRNLTEEQKMIYKKRYAQQKRYEDNLWKNSNMIEYLKSRGLTEEAIQEWGLGLVDNTHPSEQHRNRISFPLFDDYGMTPALAFRRTDESQPNKYVNNSENALYIKGEYLYGFNKAKGAIKKAKYAIITEGYFDVILPHQLGLKNVVGICGTAFTDKHVEKLKTVTNHVVLWLDTDPAGMNTMKKVMPKLLSEGFEVDIIIGGQGEDPADVIVNNGHNKPKIFEYMQRNRYPAVFYFVKEMINEYERQRIYLQRNTLEKVQAITDHVQDRNTKIWVENYLNKNLF